MYVIVFSFRTVELHLCKVMAKNLTNHKHYLYIVELQPKCVIEEAPYSPFKVCPELITKDEAKKLGAFHHIAGTKRFCSYVLVYDKCNLKAASDPKLNFAWTVMLVSPYVRKV